MDVIRWLKMAGTHVCCSSLLSLLPVLHSTGVRAVTTPSEQDAIHQASKDDKEKEDMLKGLAAGFGFFFGLIILVCLIWCLCCGNLCSSKDEQARDKRLKSKGKVSPSPPHSANVRTRPTATSSP